VNVKDKFTVGKVANGYVVDLPVSTYVFADLLGVFRYMLQMYEGLAPTFDGSKYGDVVIKTQRDQDDATEPLSPEQTWDELKKPMEKFITGLGLTGRMPYMLLAALDWEMDIVAKKAAGEVLHTALRSMTGVFTTDGRAVLDYHKWAYQVSAGERDEQLLAIRNFGPASLAKLKGALVDLSYVPTLEQEGVATRDVEVG
jgi:hypothetical protein